MRRQDPLYSLRLVEIVEKYPCLYDFNLKEYNFRDVTNSAWERVADEMKDTANNCRKYWRHLRIVFARNLKKDPHGTGARSFLQEKLLFLKPFMKITEPENSYFSNSSPINFKEEPDDMTTTLSTLNADNIDIDGGDIDKAMVQKCNDDFNHITRNDEEWTPPDDRNNHDEVNQNYNIIQQERYRKRKFDQNLVGNCVKFSDERQENYRRHYLISLLPDVEEMNAKQFRLFRKKVDEFIAEIL